MSDVLEMRLYLPTALLVPLECTTARTLKMPESCVRAVPVLAVRETSDFKEAMLRVDVWKSATTISGAQCAMTPGIALMLK